MCVGDGRGRQSPDGSPRPLACSSAVPSPECGQNLGRWWDVTPGIVTFDGEGVLKVELRFPVS